jgi:hypothetical protein
VPAAFHRTLNEKGVTLGAIIDGLQTIYWDHIYEGSGLEGEELVDGLEQNSNVAVEHFLHLASVPKS